MKRQLMLVCMLVGCSAPYAVRPGDLKPLQASIPVDQRHAVWEHAINVLLDEGYMPQVLNESAGFISAKERDDVDSNLANTIAVVTISAEGIVRVEVAGFGVFHSQSEIISAVGTVQNRLLAEIMTRPAPAQTPSS